MVSDRNGRASTTVTSQVGPKSDGSCFATLAPNVGRGLSGQNLEGRRTVVTYDKDLWKTPRLMGAESQYRMTEFDDVFSDARDMPMDELWGVQNDPLSCKGKDNRPQSAPASWMAAITARVNSLWKSFYERPTVSMPIVDKMSGECVGSMHPPLVEIASLEDRRSLPLRREVPATLVDIDQQGTTEKRPATDGIWREDDDVEISLERPFNTKSTADLDTRIPPRSGRSVRTQDNSDTHRKTPSCRSRSESKHKERPDTERRRNPRPEERYVADRKTDEHPIDQEERRSSRRRREKSVSKHRRVSSSDKRSGQRRNSSQSSRYHANGRRDNSGRIRKDPSPPSSDSSDSNEEDRTDDYRRRRNRRPDRLRRRDNSPSDGDNGSDDGDSSEDGDTTEVRRVDQDVSHQVAKV